jgi:energy-coupling factor transporter ATP-binding protein EcfA2
VQLGYVDQSRDALDPTRPSGRKSPAATTTSCSASEDELARLLLAFNFKGGDQQKKVGALSGGERNRVHLAKMLKSGANVLLLDEPTNDLDVETLRALEEALEDFAGCAVIISHDRWFLDRIATHILAFEGDSHVEWFEGNFSPSGPRSRSSRGSSAATSPRFAEPVDDLVGLAPDFWAHHHDRVIVGGLAQRIMFAVKSESRRLDLATEHRRVDAMDDVGRVGCVGVRDMVDDDVDTPGLQRVEHFDVHAARPDRPGICAWWRSW